MPLDHMNIFVYQTLVSLSKTHLRSTNNEKIFKDFSNFCDYFAEKLDLKKN